MIKESKQLRDEKKRSTIAKPKGKGGVLCQNLERRVFFDQLVASPEEGKFPASLQLFPIRTFRQDRRVAVTTSRPNQASQGITQQPTQWLYEVLLRCHWQGQWICEFDYNVTMLITLIRIWLSASRGRLRENIAFWRSIGASWWLLKLTSEDYCLPFELPKNMFFRNYSSASCNPEFVSSKISKLLLSGAMVEVSFTDLSICNPFGVAFNSSRKPTCRCFWRFLGNRFWQDWKHKTTIFPATKQRLSSWQKAKTSKTVYATLHALLRMECAI